MTNSPYGINIISEPDIYRLVMRSNLPSAKKFKDWICGEVLPSLRKHEQYTLCQETMDNEELLAKASLLKAL